VSDSAFRVFLAVLDFSRGSRGCIASNLELGVACGGKKASAVKEALAELETLGKIRRIMDDTGRVRKRIEVVDRPLEPALQTPLSERKGRRNSGYLVAGKPTREVAGIPAQIQSVGDRELIQSVAPAQPTPELLPEPATEVLAPTINDSTSISPPTTNDPEPRSSIPGEPVAEQAGSAPDPLAGLTPERQVRYQAIGQDLLGRRAPARATPVSAPTAGNLGPLIDRIVGRTASSPRPAPEEVVRPAPAPPGPRPIEGPRPSSNARAEVLEALAHVDFGCELTAVDRALRHLVRQFKPTDRRDSQRCYADLLHRVRRGELTAEAVAKAYREACGPKVRNPGAVFVKLATRPARQVVDIPVTADDIRALWAEGPPFASPPPALAMCET
jgi:hypothetical protein